MKRGEISGEGVLEAALWLGLEAGVRLLRVSHSVVGSTVLTRAYGVCSSVTEEEL